jgi:hypothetical protein
LPWQKSKALALTAVRSEGVDQVVEHLPQKHEALSSNQYHQKGRKLTLAEKVCTEHQEH